MHSRPTLSWYKQYIIVYLNIYTLKYIGIILLQIFDLEFAKSFSILVKEFKNLMHSLQSIKLCLQYMQWQVGWRPLGLHLGIYMNPILPLPYTYTLRVYGNLQLKEEKLTMCLITTFYQFFKKLDHRWNSIEHLRAFILITILLNDQDFLHL